jgi:hypothetical protein
MTHKNTTVRVHFSGHRSPAYYVLKRMLLRADYTDYEINRILSGYLAKKGGMIEDRPIPPKFSYSNRQFNII